MVLTITPAGTGLLVGPGIPIGVSSDRAPGLSLPAVWQFNFSHAATPGVLVQTLDVPALFKSFGDAMLVTPEWSVGQVTGQQLVTDDSVHLVVNLIDQTGTFDTGSTTATWDAQSGLGVQASRLASWQANAAGLSPAEQAQLTDIQTRVTDVQAAQTLEVTDAASSTTPFTIQDSMSYVSMDALSLIEVTAGPTGDFVGFDLTAFTFAIIVRIASVPVWTQPRTPDGDYYEPTLAVVRIFHGSDLFLRVPIHTTSKIVEIPTDLHRTFVQAVESFLWPNAVTLQVTWLDGVTGQVFRQVLPV